MGLGLEIFHIVAAFFMAIGIADFFYEMFRIVYRIRILRKRRFSPKRRSRKLRE